MKQQRYPIPLPMLTKLRLYTLFCLLLAKPVVAQVTFEPAFPNIGFEFAVEIQNAGDGTNRLFVAEQSGTIKVFPNSKNVSQAQVSNFLDISNRVAFNVGEEIGLLGLAFHPDFENNNLFYVYYTADSPANNANFRIVVEQFTANGNSADASSGQVILQFDKNQFNNNHNGGKIGFGPDGYLYVSVGDGGGGGDPQRNAQNLNNVFGKLLRVDVDLDDSNPVADNGLYEIPRDNPFVGRAGLDIIYAYGIRNTWKFAFDNPTGRLWAADVGQNGSRAREEINLIENGGNYGWSRFQDDVIWNSDVPDQDEMVGAIFSYDHSRGDRSITGGYVFRGSNVASTNPDIKDKYIYGDFVTGRVWALDYNETTGNVSSTLLFRTSGQSISSFGEDERGNLYFSDYGSAAQLFQLVGGESQDGTTVDGVGEWSSLEQGTDGSVRATAKAVDGTIYHAGTFSRAGNLAVGNIAAWREGEGWSRLDTGANGTVNTLAVDASGNLFIGGAFTSVGGVNANNVAMWDGTNWAALEQGVNGAVASLAINPNNGNVIVGGTFRSAGGNAGARNIAQWNGNSWANLQDSDNGTSGLNNEVRSLHIDDNGVLYVGGNFDEAGGRVANRIATWDGNRWGTLGQGTSGFVQSISSDANFVYIGGNFAIAGEQTVNRIARWNKGTSQWQSLGNGLSGAVNSLVLDQSGTVYAGGSFVTASPSAGTNYIVNNVASWSETDGWRALGTNADVGVDIQVNALLNTADGDGSQINVAGSFSQAGAIAASNTSNWQLGDEPDEPPPSVIPTLTLNNNSWHQFSLPCDPGDNNTVAALFGDDNLGTYGPDWIIWAFDAVSGNYQSVSTQTPLVQGAGYWVFQRSGGVRELDMPANCAATPRSIRDGCPVSTGCFATPITGVATSSAWQLLGYPFAYSGNASQSSIATSDGNCVNGCTFGSDEANLIVAPDLWTYDGTDYTRVGPDGVFKPWSVYWALGRASVNGSDSQFMFWQEETVQ